MRNSMKMTLRFVHGGAERTVTAGPSAIVAFERHWGTGIGKALQDSRIEHLAWMAVKLFDDWLADLEDLEVIDTDDPT